MDDVAGFAAHIAARCPSGATPDQITAWGNAPAPAPPVPNPGPAAPAAAPAPAAQAAPAGTASTAGDPADPSVPAAPAAGALSSPTAARQLFESDDTDTPGTSFFCRQGCRPCIAMANLLKTCVHRAGAGQAHMCCLNCSANTRPVRREYIFERRDDGGGSARATGVHSILTVNSTLNLGSLFSSFSVATGSNASSDHHVSTALKSLAASRGITPHEAFLCRTCVAPYRTNPVVTGFAETLARHAPGSWLWIVFPSCGPAHARSDANQPVSRAVALA